MTGYKKIDNYLVKEEEIGFINRIFDENIDGKNPIAISRILQDDLNEVLNSFVNGGFSNLGYVAYPIVKGVSKFNLDKMDGIKLKAKYLHKNGFDFSQSRKFLDKKSTYHSFPKMLSALYSDFSKLRIKGKATEIKKRCEPFDINDYNDRDYVKPIASLMEYSNKKLKNLLLGFYLHGSIATKDYMKGWSDVDTTAIVTKRTIDDPKRLVQLRDNMYYMRRFLYKIDPLQHHGSIVISEHDIESYPDAYFPLVIFNYSNSLFDDDVTISFKKRKSLIESYQKMFWFVSYFRELAESKKMSSYDLKMLLHAITLFPSLYLHCKGVSVYKKFSFDLARKDFDQLEWDPIDEVTKIRSKWVNVKDSKLASLISNFNPLLGYRINFKISDAYKSLIKENNLELNSLVKKMHSLSEAAWEKVKSNAKI